MNKCCDNCNNNTSKKCVFGEISPEDSIRWDDSKDYCSKWEEKDELVHFVGMMSNDPGLTKQQAEIVWNVFKQRIEESLDEVKKMGDIYDRHYLEIDINDIDKAFNWIS